MDGLSYTRSTSEILIYRLLLLYAGVSPLIAFRIGENAAIGAVDFLLFPAIFSLIFFRGTSINSITFPYFGFLVFAALTFLFNIGGSGFQVGDFAFIRVLGIFLPFALVFKYRGFGRQEYVGLIRAFLIGGGAAIVIGIILFHLGVELRADQQRIWAGDGLGSAVRAGGLLGNSSNFGHFTAIWGTVCLASLALISPKRAKTLTVIVLSLAAYSTFISSSRAALLHLFAGMIFLIPLFIGPKQFLQVVLVGGLALAVGSLLFSGGALDLGVLANLRRLDLLNLTGESQFLKTVRYENWQVLLQIWSDNAIMGVGYKNIEALYGIYSDNAFIGVFLELGVVPGICFILFWISLIGRLVYLAVNRSRWAWGGLAICVSELSHALTLDTYSLWYSMPLAMLFMAAIVRVSSLDFLVSRRPQMSWSVHENTLPHPAR